jgi:hypothetical protein
MMNDEMGRRIPHQEAKKKMEVFLRGIFAVIHSREVIFCSVAYPLHKKAKIIQIPINPPRK